MIKTSKPSGLTHLTLWINSYIYADDKTLLYRGCGGAAVSVHSMQKALNNFLECALSISI